MTNEVELLNELELADESQANEIEDIQPLEEDWLRELADSLDPEKAKERATWRPLSGPQNDAFYSEADELFYGGAAGGGKGQKGSTRVITPFGSKLLSELKRGDQICAADGTVQKVLNIYPQGKKQFYRITFIDGASCEVTEDHIFMYWPASKRIKAERQYLMYNPDKGVRWEDVRGRLEETRYLYDYHKQQEQAVENGKRPYWIIMPLSKPVKYTRSLNRYDKPHYENLHPYVCGILISEGSLGGKNSTVSFASDDREVVSRVKELMPSVHSITSDKKNVSHAIIKNGADSYYIRDALEHFGLWGHLADTKFIPDTYKYRSVEDRKFLMQGLIDGDGYVDDRGHMSYTTISEQLAKDVQQLAWSLGCKASITSKIPTYTDGDGNKQDGQLAYTVWIQGENLEELVYLPRKKELCKKFNGGISEPGRRVTNIEKIDIDEAFCISVDHPQSLYVHDDFVVSHNTDLMMGLACSELSPHRKAILFRRSYGENKDVILRIQELFGATFKAGNAMRFEGLSDNKTLEIGSVPNFAAAQKYKGRAHDLKLFDEVSDIPEAVYTFLIGWARTNNPNIPVRVVASGNPPTNQEGRWVIRRWAPWIDPNHTNPAEPGELRWFATLDGVDTEITPEISEAGSRGEEFEYTTKSDKVEIIQPKSRTFIPAKLEDNPIYAKTGYRSVLQNMPEPYRTQLLEGDFGISMKEDPWQVVPSKWVTLARQKYDEAEEKGLIEKHRFSGLCYGLDVSEHGPDETVFLPLTYPYIQEIVYFEDPDTMKIADDISLLLKNLRGLHIGIDVIGPGLGLGQRLRQMNFKVAMIKGTYGTNRRTADGEFGFYNLRSEIWWRIREALDPDGANPICLPNNPKLLEELITPKYSITNGKIPQIAIETKKEVQLKLNRSPDTANALGYALFVNRNIRRELRMF